MGLLTVIFPLTKLAFDHWQNNFSAQVKMRTQLIGK